MAYEISVRHCHWSIRVMKFGTSMGSEEQRIILYIATSAQQNVTTHRVQCYYFVLCALANTLDPIKCAGTLRGMIADRAGPSPPCLPTSSSQRKFLSSNDSVYANHASVHLLLSSSYQRGCASNWIGGLTLVCLCIELQQELEVAVRVQCLACYDLRCFESYRAK
jgi:hypothetical protein